MAICESCNSPNLHDGKCIDCGHVQSHMMTEARKSLQTSQKEKK